MTNENVSQQEVFQEKTYTYAAISSNGQSYNGSTQAPSQEAAVEKEPEYNLAFTIRNVRDDQKDVLHPASPFTIALLSESEIIDFFKLIELKQIHIKSIKSLIKNRNNNLAHAKGGIELDPDERIGQYLSAFEEIQQQFQNLNVKIAKNWISEINAGDNMEQFLEIHFLDSFVSLKDFEDMLWILLSSDQLDLEQWKQVVNTGIELTYSETISTLKLIAQSSKNNSKRLDSIKMLSENGELDKSM